MDNTPVKQQATPTPIAPPVQAQLIPSSLKNLLICWYISAGFMIATSVVVLFSQFTLLTQASTNAKGVSFVYLSFALLIIILGINVYLIAVCRRIWHGNRNGALFLKIYGGISILSFPFGTALGIATLIILRNPEVKQYLK